MEDAKEQARDHLARFRDSVQPRVDSVQNRIRQVPDRLQNISLPEHLQRLPDRIPRSLPRPGSPRRHARSGSDSSPPLSPAQPLSPSAPPSWALPPSPPQPPPPPQQLQRAPSLTAQAQSAPAQPAPAQSAPAPSAPAPSVPALSDPAYSPELAALAGKILYRSPGSCPISGGPLMVLCASAFPDASTTDYNVLLPYVLANLPADDELNSSGDGYSVVFFAGGGGLGASGGLGAGAGGDRPTWKWTLQAYTLVGVFREIAHTLDEDPPAGLADGRSGDAQLGRAVRKKIQRLWVVHEKSWIRTILEIMTGVVSAKFKKKIIHLGTLSDLAAHIDLVRLRVPPSAYVYDRRLEAHIELRGFPIEPVFCREPFRAAASATAPLPTVLTDTAAFLQHSCLGVEGLFRVPPSQALLECARDCYDRGTRLHWPDWGVHTAAALTKLYYRSLPRPVIPADHYEQMLSLVAVDPDPARRAPEEVEREVRFEVVRALLTASGTGAGLPAYARRLLLHHLLPLLAAVTARCAANKMTAANLAVCVAGSLARSDDLAADARASPGIRKFVEIAIERFAELDGEPALPGDRRLGHSLPSSPVDGGRRQAPALALAMAFEGTDAIRRKPLPSEPGALQPVPNPAPSPTARSNAAAPVPTLQRQPVPSHVRPARRPVPPRKASLLRPVAASASPALAPGTFVRPQLRRVASVNFRPSPSPAAESSLEQSGNAARGPLAPPPALRRAKSQLVGPSTGLGVPVPVRELKMLWEEKARQEAALVPVRRQSTIDIS